MMNFTYVEFPCTVDLNTFKAYFNPNRVILPKTHSKLQGGDGYNGNDVPTNQTVSSLRHLVLDSFIENWKEHPIYKELPRQADRNYMLSNLDTNLPLQTLSAHISADFFWRKAYQQRWKVLRTPTQPKPWINIYMERHLQEFMEQQDPCDFEQERVQSELDTCAAYINHLELDYLQPSMGERSGGYGKGVLYLNKIYCKMLNGIVFDHIPLDFILSNLPELHTLRITYATKTVGIHYYLGCNMLSQNDILYLAKGLSRSHELRSFCLHSTKLMAYQLRYIARSLDKGCHLLTSLSLVHTAIGDEGLRQFLESCTRESFATLKTLDLTNNKITTEGAFLLSRTFKGRSLEKLALRCNPIGSDGAAAIFSMLHFMPLKHLDLGTCSMCVAITKLFMQLIVQNKTLLELDVTNNELGEEFGKHLYKIIGFNKTLQSMDLRNTGITLETRNNLKEVLDKNMKKDLFQKKVNCML